MAEIVGIAASILQIAGAGVKLSTTLYNFVGSATRADQDITDIAGDVEITANALDSVGMVFQDEDSRSVVSKKAIQDAKNLITRCESVFNEIHELTKRKVGKDGKKSLSAFGKFAWPMKEQRVQVLRARLESLKTSLNLLFNVLQLANGQARGKMEKETLEIEREKIRQLHQRQQDSIKALADLERKIGNVRLDEDEETLRGSSAPSRVSTMGLMALSTLPQKNNEVGKDDVPHTEVSDHDSDSTMTEDSETSDTEHLTMDDLSKCANHVTKLLRRISTLQQSFESTKPSPRLPKKRVRKLYHRFCRKFESDILLEVPGMLPLPDFRSTFFTVQSPANQLQHIQSDQRSRQGLSQPPVRHDQFDVAMPMFSGLTAVQQLQLFQNQRMGASNTSLDHSAHNQAIAQALAMRRNPQQQTPTQVQVQIAQARAIAQTQQQQQQLQRHQYHHQHQAQPTQAVQHITSQIMQGQVGHISMQTGPSQDTAMPMPTRPMIPTVSQMCTPNPSFNPQFASQLLRLPQQKAQSAAQIAQPFQNKAQQAQMQQVQMHQQSQEIVPGAQTEEAPLDVNAKQFHRILKRRLARQKLENALRLTPKAVGRSGPYLNESGSHSCPVRRPRGPTGRFLTAGEVAVMEANKGGKGDADNKENAHTPAKAAPSSTASLKWTEGQPLRSAQTSESFMPFTVTSHLDSECEDELFKPGRRALGSRLDPEVAKKAHDMRRIVPPLHSPEEGTVAQGFSDLTEDAPNVEQGLGKEKNGEYTTSATTACLMEVNDDMGESEREAKTPQQSGKDDIPLEDIHNSPNAIAYSPASSGKLSPASSRGYSPTSPRYSPSSLNEERPIRGMSPNGAQRMGGHPRYPTKKQLVTSLLENYTRAGNIRKAKREWKGHESENGRIYTGDEHPRRLHDDQLQLQLVEQQNIKRHLEARQRDYKIQLKLLEQQNKKRLMLARREQDNTGLHKNMFPRAMSPQTGRSGPALTPASNVLSYSSRHSSSSMTEADAISPTSRASMGDMRPTLNSVSAMPDMSAAVPTSGLATAFNADSRRRYSGNLLQKATPHSREDDHMDMSEESRRNSESMSIPTWQSTTIDSTGRFLKRSNPEHDSRPDGGVDSVKSSPTVSGTDNNDSERSPKRQRRSSLDIAKVEPNSHSHFLPSPQLQSVHHSVIYSPSHALHGPPSVLGNEGLPPPAPRPQGPSKSFTVEDDQLLIVLKEEKNLTWKQIADFFPGRSTGSLQVRYVTKLRKRKSEPESIASDKIACRRCTETNETCDKLTPRCTSCANAESTCVYVSGKIPGIDYLKTPTTAPGEPDRPDAVNSLSPSSAWNDPFMHSPNYSSSSGYDASVPGASDYANMFAQPPCNTGANRTRTPSNVSFIKPPLGHPSRYPTSVTSTMGYSWPDKVAPASANMTVSPGVNPMMRYAPFAPKLVSQRDEEEQASERDIVDILLEQWTVPGV